MKHNAETEPTLSLARAQPRTADQIEGDIAASRARIREINEEMYHLRAERDTLNDFRSVLQEELLEALGRELEAAKESQP